MRNISALIFIIQLAVANVYSQSNQKKNTAPNPSDVVCITTNAFKPPQYNGGNVSMYNKIYGKMLYSSDDVRSELKV